MKTRIFSRALLAMYSTSMSMPFPFRYEKTFRRYAKARLRGAYFLFFFGGDARADGVALTSVAVRLLRSTNAVRLTERGLVALSMLSNCVVNERAPACLPDGASARRGAER